MLHQPGKAIVLTSMLFTLLGCGREENSALVDESEQVLASQFERPPVIASISSATVNLTFIGLHAKPDNAESEFLKINDVVSSIKTKVYSEKVLVMGDLNLDCSYASQTSISRFPILSVLKMLVPSTVDTTTGQSDCAYDRALSNLDFKTNVINGAVSAFSDHHAISASIDGFGTICAWNAQRLSSSKVTQNPNLKDAALELFNQCDLTFVQEVMDDQAIKAITDPSSMKVKLSDKLGSTSYKECYALVERGLSVSRFKTLGRVEGEGNCQSPIEVTTNQIPGSQTPTTTTTSATTNTVTTAPTATHSGTTESSSCGISPYKTPGGYCYANKNGKKVRVANSCC